MIGSGGSGGFAPGAPAVVPGGRAWGGLNGGVAASAPRSAGAVAAASLPAAVPRGRAWGGLNGAVAASSPPTSSGAISSSSFGVAAILVAAKYEEISPPPVEDFCYITDNTYTKHELLQMEEGDILKLLKIELGSPTIKRTFLLFEFLGSYLAELSLLDYGCLQYLPSLVAGSVVFLARLTIDPHSNPWDHKLQKITGYKISELKDCIVAIHCLQVNGK